MQIKVNPKVAEHLKSWIGLIILLSGLAMGALKWAVMPWILEVSDAHYILTKNDQYRELVYSYAIIPDKKAHQLARLAQLEEKRKTYKKLADSAYDKGYLKQIPE